MIVGADLSILCGVYVEISDNIVPIPVPTIFTFHYTCCSHSGSVDDPDQNNFQKNFTNI